MEQYVHLEHMIQINCPLHTHHYCFPNQPKESNTNNSSSKNSTLVFLNDILYTGSQLQINISDILLTFRLHRVVFICDIHQMKSEDTDTNPSGSSCMSIHVGRSTPQTHLHIPTEYFSLPTLREIASESRKWNYDNGKNYPMTAKILKTQTYVYEVLVCSSTLQEIIQL